MNIGIDSIISIITLLLGGGGLGAFFTWKYTKREARAKAISAEADAAKEVQDVYQQLITDVKADREEQKTYIQELKEDRMHLRKERDELKQQMNSLEGEVRQLRMDVSRNNRIVESMRPFMCGRSKCADRVPVFVTSEGEIQTKPKTTKKPITQRTTNK